jgi:hypothetical protein
MLHSIRIAGRIVQNCSAVKGSLLFVVAYTTHVTLLQRRCADIMPQGN